MFKVSIIVPVYNVEQYIEPCIKSILEQDLRDIEIILVDDGSKDKSGDICDRYATLDKRIKVIHKLNGGLSSARNAGIDIAAGDYLGFVDGDDIIASNMYSKMYFQAISNDADIVACSYQEILKNQILTPSSTSETEILTHKTALQELFKGEKFFVSAWNKLYKRELFENIRYPIGKIHEDMFTTYKVFDRASIVVYINAKLYGYVIRENSITHVAFDEKRFDNLEAIEEILLYFSDAESELLELLFKLCYEKSLYILNMICNCALSFKLVKYYNKYRMFVVKHQKQMLSSNLLEASDKKHIVRVVRRGIDYFFVYKYRDTLERFQYRRIKNKIKSMLFDK